MTGMGKGLQANDPTVLAAFHSALLHQLGILAVVAVVLAVAGNVVSTVRFKRAVASGTVGSKPVIAWPYPEPAARRLLRFAFGGLWILDGLLQAQSSMPLGLPGGVLTPAASSTPGWVQHLVNVGATIWSDHPVTAAAATVWIQIGIGVFVLVAPRGYWSRAAGLVSAGWALIIWVFGEAFGGVFGHGSSWLVGLPGAAVFYLVAGVLLALPERTFETPRLGTRILQGFGIFFIGMGVLQALPGRGFWTGRPHPSSVPGTLDAMIGQMAKVSQPSVFSSWIRAFGSFDAAHGWGVNLVAAVLLVAVGACFLSGRPPLLRVGVLAGIVVCLADWVLVQDFGFFGGVGTDPNSMIPMAVVFTAAYLAVIRVPAAAPAAAEVPEVATADRSVGRLDRLSPGYLARCLAAVGAAAIVLVGAAPMAVAATNPNADPILTEALDGTPNVVNEPAPGFTLTGQSGQPVSLHSLLGHTVVLTFLDPVCTSDCPLIAQELRLTDQLLGSAAATVDLVAVVDNPLFHSTAATQAFDNQEGLDHLANWHFLTGSITDLSRVWNGYGVQTDLAVGGAMVAHSDLVYIVDPRGRIREVFDATPGTTPASYSSFSALLAAQTQRFIHS
jgi:cytochrome oxidase Cu insertion factor (SCO1/SenC/PrrC family)